MEQKPQPDLPPASPGDPLPQIILPEATGKGVNLSHQNLSGRWQVLAFVNPDDAPSRIEASKAARERLRFAEGVFFTIALGEPDSALQGADLFDASRKVTTLLAGQPAPGIAVISPEGRLAARFDDGAVDQAVSYCEEHYTGQSEAVLRGFAPVLMIENILSADLCRRIIDFWEGAPKTQDAVASKQQGNEAAIAAIKRRTDAVIQNDQLFEDIKRRVGQCVLPLIGRAYHMQIASMEALRVGCYKAEDNGAFGRHRDNTTPFTAHRRLAKTLNLNSGEYEGGELRFPEYGRALYEAPTGGAVIFSCSLLHEALPVTKGQRFGLFTFFTDPAGIEQEKKMRTQMEAQQAKQA